MSELQKLKKNRATFVKKLDVSVEFLSHLSDEEVITDEHREIIKSKATNFEKVDSLIDILGRREKAKYGVFCDVLRSHNSELADLLTGSSKTDSLPGNSSPKQATQKLKKQADFRIEDFDERTLKTKTRQCTTRFSSFDPKGFIFGKLAEAGILTNRKLKELNDIANPEDRWNALRHHLFDCGHPKSITTFLKALRDSDEKADNDILEDILDTQVD